MHRASGQLESRAEALLRAAARGDRSAAEQLLPLVYDQLRRAAQKRLKGERAGHTLSATALVHEAYLRLVGPRRLAWVGKGHFYAAAAEAMRRILIDHARSRARREFREHEVGEESKRTPASVADLFSDENSDLAVRLDDALRRLESEDPGVAQVVRLRFYAGLSGEEAAAALGRSPATVDRDWAWARAWLFAQVRHADRGGSARARRRT